VSLREAFKEGEFVYTCEIDLPHGTNIISLQDKFKLLHDKVHAVNVPDNQRAMLRMSSLGGAMLLKQNGIEPILQVSCRDRNRLAIQADLLSAWTFGIENVLCMTGDHTLVGDYRNVKPVYELDSVNLIALVKRLNEGYDSSHKKLDGKPNFLIGAVFNPSVEPIEPELIKLEKKIRAGAQFIQTQPVFELEKFAKILDSIKNYNVKILPGVIVFRSYENALFARNRIPGVEIPDHIIRRLKLSKDTREEGIKIAKECIEFAKEYCDGIHIFTLGHEEILKEIL